MKPNLNTWIIITGFAAVFIYLMWFQPSQTTERELILQQKLTASEQEREGYRMKADSAVKEKIIFLSLIETALGRVKTNNDTIKKLLTKNIDNKKKNEAHTDSVVALPDLEFMRALSRVATDTGRSAHR